MAEPPAAAGETNPPAGPAPESRAVAQTPPAQPPLQDQRDLIYLYFRLHQLRQVEAVASRVLRDNPGDRATLRLLTTLYLEQKKAEQALRYARQWVRFFPDDTEASYNLAMAWRMAGHPELAGDILRRLKRDSFRREFFPYEADLASTSAASGDWLQAIHSYRTLLSEPGLDPGQQQSARAELDQLYLTHLPQAEARETFVQLTSGAIFRTRLDYSRPLTLNHRFFATFEREDLDIYEADLLRAEAVAHNDFFLGLQNRHSPAWSSRLWAGWGDKGPNYGASLTRVFPMARQLTMAFHGHQRAIDSLLLEALGGRQDELSFTWSGPLPPHLAVSFAARGRRIELDHETLGYGYGLSLNVEHPLINRNPQLNIGYRNLVTGFFQESRDGSLVANVADASTGPADRRMILENLVSSINLHGVYLSLEQQLGEFWVADMLLGTDYSFDRSTLGYEIETGIGFVPRRSIRIQLQAGYSTSASTSDRDSERVQVDLAFKMYY